MAKKFKIRFLPIFYKDLDSIIDYLVKKLSNPIAANNLLDEIEKEINKRAFNPNDYEVFISRKRRLEPYYKIYVKNYIIFYVVKKDVMEIRRILYRKRNYKDLKNKWL